MRSYLEPLLGDDRVLAIFVIFADHVIDQRRQEEDFRAELRLIHHETLMGRRV